MPNTLQHREPAPRPDSPQEQVAQSIRSCCLAGSWNSIGLLIELRMTLPRLPVFEPYDLRRVHVNDLLCSRVYEVPPGYTEERIADYPTPSERWIVPPETALMVVAETVGVEMDDHGELTFYLNQFFTE